MLGMTTNDWAWNATLYFIPFVIFEIPSTLLLKYSTPRLHQFRISLLWGIVTACHAAVKNKHQLWALRFLLGMFEAGLFPAMLAQLTYWYRPDEQSTRMALLSVLGSFADFLTAFISYGFSFTSGRGPLAGWQWIFIVEGSLTIILSFIIWKFLPNYPDDSKWLTDEERAFLLSRLPESSPKATDKSFSLSEVIRGLKRPESWLFSFLKLFQILGTYGLSYWLPSILKNWGITSASLSPLLTVPVSIVSIISGIGFSFLVDYTICLPSTIAILSLIATLISYIVLTVVTNKGVLYAFTILTSFASSADFSVLTSWLSISLKGTSEIEFIFGFSNGLAQVSRIIGPQIYRSKYAPRYTIPFGISLGFIGLSLICVVLIYFVTKEKTIKVYQEKKRKLLERKQNYDGKPIYNDNTEAVNENGEIFKLTSDDDEFK
ncbi:hypothetical protein WICMUC_000382 [Wickerhamomyces mucosus]|uniref:Major facilitator superfamily (MFS) profile domain-containing protein n=1 Tax=Wickerhamomyces mucosus TaxID=1378264 RepID=A0A9P8TIX2_9ASCO|nr:hypothetical protein WICMUC_000382 [Wickerhamomyces mucosus]